MTSSVVVPLGEARGEKLKKELIIKRRIRKNKKDAERAGLDFLALVAEVNAESNPSYKVPPEYAEQFKKFVADNKDRRQIYPRFDVVAYGLGLNLDKSLRDADRERMTEERFGMPNPDDPRTARRLLHESTGWFPKK
jgi:hypothetical protein